MSSFNDLLERNSIVEVVGFDEWSTEDLVELDGLVSAELQDRAHRTEESCPLRGTYP